MCVSDYRFNQVKTERDKIPLFYMNKLNYEIISGSFSPPTQHLRKLSCFHSIRFDFDWNWQEITQPSLSIHEQGKWSGSDSGHDLVVIFFILAHFSFFPHFLQNFPSKTHLRSNDFQWILKTRINHPHILNRNAYFAIIFRTFVAYSLGLFLSSSFGT